MRMPHRFAQTLFASVILITLSSVALAADPGSPLPAASEVSDQKTGSVLFYNLFSSSAANPNVENTRFNITNTNTSFSAAVHLFFVDGTTGEPTDATICLTPNQTASFLASEIDPGTTGYLVAVAIDNATGCPIRFNFLSGDAFVKLATGHEANLGAEAFAALYTGTLPGCSANSTTAALNFDGTSYNRAPRVLAVDRIRSPNDGNSTLLVLNRVGGSLVTGVSPIGTMAGLLFDDQTGLSSFIFASDRPQFRALLSDSFPPIIPPLSSVIPSGHTGWLKVYATEEVGLLGAVINFNPDAVSSPPAFNSGHNLHKLTLSTTNTFVIPIRQPRC